MAAAVKEIVIDNTIDKCKSRVWITVECWFWRWF